MPSKLYVFGSSHIDHMEKAELKPLLRRIGETNGIVAAEFENDRYTTAALKHFKDLNDKQVRAVVQHQFGKRRVIAPYNFLKMAQKEEEISEIVSIEPRFEGEVKRLSKAVMNHYREFEEYFKHIKTHLDEKRGIDELITLYAREQAALARQCIFREKHMSRFVADVVNRNPGDTLLYTSYVHAASIK